jgi:hypothetical protein
MFLWEQGCVFIGIDMYSGYGFAFHSINVSACTAIHVHHGILYNIDSNQGIYSIAKELLASSS